MMDRVGLIGKFAPSYVYMQWRWDTRRACFVTCTARILLIPVHVTADTFETVAVLTVLENGVCVIDRSLAQFIGWKDNAFFRSNVKN